MFASTMEPFLHSTLFICLQEPYTSNFYEVSPISPKHPTFQSVIECNLVEV